MGVEQKPKVEALEQREYKDDVTPERLAKALLRRVTPIVKPKKKVKERTHA